MVKLEEAVTARFSFQNERFEILVDPDLALKLKKGETVNFDELLAIDTVFKDASKGTEASPAAINKAFGTNDIPTIAKKIIAEGTVQITTEQRRDMREARKREIVELIARNALNPQTKAPHPPKRIENALAEARIQVDEMKSAEAQLPGIIKELKQILPISMEKMQIAVKVPAEFGGKASAMLHKYDLKKEEWQRDGSLIAIVELPPGLRNDFLNALNHLTHGSIETKILEGSR